MNNHTRFASGFTLIELSIVIAIIGVILYGSMSLLVTGVQTAQVNSTVTTMDAIEKALLDFRVAFGRIPCPSDLTATASSANYGVEAANTGSCTGGSPAANFIAASGTAEGGIPTRALRLPDNYMYDGWGHKFRYAVNPNYTVTTSTSCSLGTSPAITVNDASGAARSTSAVYTITSHGANGHGAYTSNGIVVNAGSTNADELTNCHCTSTGAANTYSPTYVQKYPTIATAGSPLTSFDDVVTYKEFWQLMTPSLSTNSFGCTLAGYRRTLTIDHTKVGTVNNTDQSSFPVLFSGTYSYLATTANGGNVNNANGYDIYFSSDVTGNTPLPFERESWSATTGASVFWVQVPTVSHTTDTVIYLQYGNPNITTDQSNKTGTWNSNYKGVWHLGETSGSSFSDSTSYGSTGIMTGTLTQGVAGVFGNAISNNGTSGRYITVASPADQHLDFGTGSFSASLWVNMTTLPASGWDYNLLFHGGSPVSRAGYNIYGGNASGVLYWASTVTDTSGSHMYTSDENPSGYSLNTWYHVAEVVDTTAHLQHIYINGAEYHAPGSSISSLGSTTDAVNLYIAASSTDTSILKGKMQEVRVINGAESADWIVTEYNNQSSPNTFYTVGSAISR